MLPTSDTAIKTVETSATQGTHKTITKYILTFYKTSSDC